MWWDVIAVKPMINSLIALSNFLSGNLGLSIILLTIIINFALLPLVLKQIRASKAMQELQPKIAELQKKYAKDKQKLAQEQMKLYRESGMSPAGCAVPMLIQMPVWIALFQSIMRLVAIIPENFLSLSQYLYSWPVVYTALPLQNSFLWVNLASGDIFLAILVGGTMWVQQKMVTSVTVDPQQEAQNRMMLWTMPLMFGFLTMTFPGGLSIYWITSNIFRIIVQYFIGGWGALFPKTVTKKETKDKRPKKLIAPVEQTPAREAVSTDVVAVSPTAGEKITSDGTGDKHPSHGGGYPAHLRDAKRHPRRGKGRRPK